jgi:hypothetical protein
MENFLLTGNSKVPTVDFNANTGVLTIKGRATSFSGGEVDFFLPVKKWVSEYSLSPAENTTLNVQLEYYCTHVSKVLLDIFRILDKVYLSGNSVTINWYHEEDDNDMIEAADDYKNLLKVPFNLVAFNE